MIFRLFILLAVVAGVASAFTVIQPPAVVQVPSITTTTNFNTNQLDMGIASYLEKSASTLSVSLEERRPPTAEEIAAKKRNFNLLFWGGGFVAPFLATFYYFGLKFWEK